MQETADFFLKSAVFFFSNSLFREHGRKLGSFLNIVEMPVYYCENLIQFGYLLWHFLCFQSSILLFLYIDVLSGVRIQ